MLSLPMSPLIGYMVLNDVTWQNLQETYRGPMIEALRKAVESLNVKTIKLEQEALKAMKEEGLVIHEPPADAQEKWRAAPIRGMEDVAGNWPDRFKCLVSHDGNLDERAAYYDTEELWFPKWDHVGTPWDNPQGYEKHNPANFVKNWKTPMLIVHGGQDFRVVETQGLSSFNALQRRGIPSRFLYFPDENHWILKPANSILWHETVIGWLDRWLK
jgi:pimeloyl-ACP methyl ester carboxylesterase